MQDSPQSCGRATKVGHRVSWGRWRCEAIVHHGEVTCHDSILRTMGDTLPLFPPLSLSQTPIIVSDWEGQNPRL